MWRKTAEADGPEAGGTDLSSSDRIVLRLLADLYAKNEMYEHALLVNALLEDA